MWWKRKDELKTVYGKIADRGVCVYQDELMDGEDIAKCPSCSLLLRIVFDEETLEALAEKYAYSD